MLSVYTVCFFGHRQVDDFQSAEQAVESFIEVLLKEHEYVEFLVGRDGEFDHIVSSAVLRCKNRMDSANCSLIWIIVKDIKADLSEAAQDKLKEMIAETVESKLQKEVKKITKKLTIKFIISGVALAGVYLLINNSDKIVDLITKPKE